MRLFSKSPKKSKKTPTSDEESPSPRSRSPLKKSSSSSSKSGKAKDENQRPGQGSARNSRSFSRAGPDSPRHPFDLNTHPLNLPPDQIRRLSALSIMSDPDRMDIESEGPTGPNGAPASPPPQTNMPGSFDSPKVNGTNGTSNVEGPVPPPHKSNPTSPAPIAAPTPEEAEAFKTAGNKFYKAKEYKKAIEEYTKGTQFRQN
jgi:DnaJ family protein C protein 7